MKKQENKVNLLSSKFLCAVAPPCQQRRPEVRKPKRKRKKKENILPRYKVPHYFGPTLNMIKIGEERSEIPKSGT